jgi:hypothetical protein
MYNSGSKVLDQCFWTKTQNGAYGFGSMPMVIELADFYNENFPNVIHFDGKDDLYKKTSPRFLKEVSGKMNKDNIKLHQKVYSAWSDMLS